MAKIVSYRDLEVWQEAMSLVQKVYEMTADLANEEKYGLRSQTQRAAVSIPTNTAEGFGRSGRVEYARFVSIARGSLMELETLLALLVRLDLVAREAMLPVWDHTQRVGKRLTALRRSLTKPQAQGPKPSSK